MIACLQRFEAWVIVCSLILSTHAFAQTTSAHAAPDRSSHPPLVVCANVPIYPTLARIAHITGTVEVQVTVTGGSVTETKATSGHPLLVAGTIENIKSWKFGPATNASFVTTFIYRVSGEETEEIENLVVELNLPLQVKVTASPIRPPTMP